MDISDVTCFQDRRGVAPLMFDAARAVFRPDGTVDPIHLMEDHNDKPEAVSEHGSVSRERGQRITATSKKNFAEKRSLKL